MRDRTRREPRPLGESRPLGGRHAVFVVVVFSVCERRRREKREKEREKVGEIEMRKLKDKKKSSGDGGGGRIMWERL